MKPETQKVAVFVLFLAVLSVVIYYLVFNGKNKKPAYIPNPNVPDQNANTGTGNTGTGNGTAATNTALFPLKKGMNNSKYVKALQKGLNQKYFTKLDADGDFGNNTQKAVETHLDSQNYVLKPSVVGVSWSLFQKLEFDKLV